jgi:hypothetical protein
MGYFSAACAGTGAFMYLFRNNARLINMNPLLLFGVTMGAMIGTRCVDY